MTDINAVSSQSAQATQRRNTMQGVMQAVEDKLGISADDLKTARKNGQSLADLAASKGVSRDDLIATVKQALTSAGAGVGGKDGDGDTDGTASVDQFAATLVDRKPKTGGEGHHHHRHATSTPAASATDTGGVSFQLPPSTAQATYV
jgi:hypothetical protein